MDTENTQNTAAYTNTETGSEFSSSDSAYNSAGSAYGSSYSGMGYMDPPPRTPQSVRAEIKRYRHKKEVPLYILMIILGLGACTILIFRDLHGEGIMQELRQVVEKVLAEETAGLETSELDTILSAILVASSLVLGIGSLVGLFIISLVSVYKIYADQMSYSVRVSEQNFPEIYAKVKEYTWLLGLKKEPEVYVQQMNGDLNAFSSWIPGKAFIQLNAEIVDLAYMEHKDFDTIYFIMAHEIGHIYLHHVQLYYTLWSVLVNFIPLIGSSILAPLLSRAREYSADRVAQALTGGVAQEDCMMLLAAGRHTYKYIDSKNYIRDITAKHNAVERFARWITNLIASHPIMPFRVKAILDPAKKSGRLV